MSELGPASQAMLEYIQARNGFIEIFRMINAIAPKTGIPHTTEWHTRRLLVLALEGRIEAKINRNPGDVLVIRFRRLRENGLEELPNIEEAEG